MKFNLELFRTLSLALWLTLLTGLAHADAPSVIRIGYPAVGVGNRPVAHGNAVATMHLRGMLEDEFRKDGIQITWSFLRGAGPAVNELFANGLLDFSALGDLPSIVGRASGLNYRLISGASVRGNIYVAVPADSSAKTIADLRGKKVAVTKGTATHLAAGKILEGFGLTEKDVRLINMDTQTAISAIVTGDIDAAFGSSQYLGLRDQGVARVIFRTTGGDPKYTSNTSFLGNGDFMQKYPEHSKRVVKTLVLAAKWLAEQEEKRESVFQLWTRTGFTFASFKEDWTGESMKYKTSPLIDEYVTSRYNFQINEAKRLGLTRKTFDFREWVEPSILQAVLQELNLQNFWAPRDLNGQPRILAAPAAPVAASGGS
jgi:sulfonate transport system substrate-binding protein